MKYILPILYLFLSTIVLSQTIIPFAAYQVEVLEVEANLPFYVVTANVTDLSGNFNGTSITSNKFVFWQNCNRYTVDSIRYAYQTEVKIVINDINGAGAPNRQISNIIQENNDNIGHYVAGMLTSQQQCIDSYYKNILQTVIVNSAGSPGPASQLDTITQSSHNIAIGTSVKYNSSNEYEATTAGDFPVGIVLDTTINTLVIAYGGNYNLSTFSSASQSFFNSYNDGNPRYSLSSTVYATSPNTDHIPAFIVVGNRIFVAPERGIDFSQMNKYTGFVPETGIDTIELEYGKVYEVFGQTEQGIQTIDGSNLNTGEWVDFKILNADINSVKLLTVSGETFADTSTNGSKTELVFYTRRSDIRLIRVSSGFVVLNYKGVYAYEPIRWEDQSSHGLSTGFPLTIDTTTNLWRRTASGEDILGVAADVTTDKILIAYDGSIFDTTILSASAKIFWSGLANLTYYDDGTKTDPTAINGNPAFTKKQNRVFVGTAGVSSPPNREISQDTSTFLLTEKSDGTTVKEYKEGILSYDNNTYQLQFSGASALTLGFINDNQNLLFGSNAGSSLSGSGYNRIIGDRAWDNITTGTSIISDGRNNGRDASGTFAYVSTFGQNIYRDATNGGSYIFATGEGSARYYEGGNYISFFGRRSGQAGKGSNIFAAGDEAALAVWNNNGTTFGNITAISNRAAYNFISTTSAVSETGGVFLGYNTGNNMTGKSLYLIGNNISSQDTVNTGSNFSNTDINTSNENITITAHPFGSTGDRFNALFTTTNTVPTGIQNNKVYQFEIVDANTVEFSDPTIDLTSQGVGTHRITLVQTIENSINIGDDLIPESNTIKLGNSSITKIIIGGNSTNIDFSSSTKIAPGHALILPANGLLPARIRSDGQIVAASTTSDTTLADFIVVEIDNDTISYVKAGKYQIANTFNEGQKYFLQDDGSVATTRDADYDQLLFTPFDSAYVLIDVGRPYATSDKYNKGQTTSVSTDGDGKFSFAHGVTDFTPSLVIGEVDNTSYYIDYIRVSGSNFIGLIRNVSDNAVSASLSGLTINWKTEN